MIIVIIVAVFAATSSVYVAYRLLGAQRRGIYDGEPPDKRPERVQESEGGNWGYELKSLRTVVLLLRSELGDARRASSVREAEVRRLVTESAARIRLLEERLEQLRRAELQTELSERDLEMLLLSGERVRED